MPLFRCYSCTNGRGLPGRMFEAEKALCPTCGAGSDHRSRQLVAIVQTIHFDPPSGIPGIGKGIRPCDGKPVVNGTASARASGELSSVTCPGCLKASGVENAPDLEVHLDFADMVISPPS